MTGTRVKTINIATAHDQARLSKGQKAFNALVKQIENRRARVADWEAAIPPYQQKYADDLLPLVEASLDLQVEMVHCLDRASEQKGLSKTERGMIASLITELAGALVADRDDAELKAIYNKHSRSDYDSEEAAAVQDMMLQLLELQLELEHIDQVAINNLSEERLQHYNRILKEQLAELEQELLHIEVRFKAQFDISPFVRVSPDTLMRSLASDIDGIRRAIRDLKRDLLAFDDLKRLKAWLREMRR